MGEVCAIPSLFHELILESAPLDAIENVSDREGIRLDEEMVCPETESESPLTGCTLLVTRSASQAPAMVGRIERLGGRVLCFPTIAITDPESWEPLDRAIAAIETYNWLVITSPNGAERFARRLQVAGPSLSALAHLRISAVGTGTAERLKDLGLRVDLIPDRFRASSLVAAMAPQLRTGERILMARGDLADPDLANRLRAMGHEVDDVTAYCTVPGSSEPGALQRLRTAIHRGSVHYALFASASAVINLLGLLGGPQGLTGVRIAVIGPQTQTAAANAGLWVDVVAKKARLNDLVDAVAADAMRRKSDQGGMHS